MGGGVRQFKKRNKKKFNLYFLLYCIVLLKFVLFIFCIVLYCLSLLFNKYLLLFIGKLKKKNNNDVSYRSGKFVNGKYVR